MTEALQTPNLPEEAVAFIKEGSPKPQAANPLLSKDEVADSERKLSVVTRKDPAEEESAVKPKPPREKKAEVAVTPGLVSVTFRLPPEVPGALLRASTERKIRRERPFTQQEIVSEALCHWLKKKGYLEDHHAG